MADRRMMKPGPYERLLREAEALGIDTSGPLFNNDGYGADRLKQRITEVTQAQGVATAVSEKMNEDEAAVDIIGRQIESLTTVKRWMTQGRYEDVRNEVNIIRRALFEVERMCMKRVTPGGPAASVPLADGPPRPTHGQE